METTPQITNPIVATKVLHEQMHNLDHEEVWIIFLTSACKMISAEMISRGTLTETAIDCRTILRQVLLHNAHSLILMHNHPSGDPHPSQADIRFTDRLNKACSLMDIHLIDHIITSEDSFFSFTEGKLINY